MNPLDGITILCEGVDQGPDVRLLESARHALGAEIPLAAAVTFRPVGGIEELNSRLRAAPHLAPGERVYAVRDRDFLTGELVAQFRSQAHQPAPVRPWPLSRHTTESYLMEPAFIESALGVPAATVLAALERLAARRIWHDAGRATLARAAYEVKRQEWPPEPSAWDEAGVLAELSGLLVSWHDGIARLPVMTDCAAICREFAADLQRDPPWTRVHGKELLKELAAALQRPALKRQLLTHAETNAPPAPLVNDLRELLKLLTASTPLAGAAS